MSPEPAPLTSLARTPAWPSVQPAAQAVYVAKLATRLAQAGSCPAMRHHGETLSGERLLASLYRYARALSCLGIGPGCLVALLAPNHPDALAIRYAANLLGAATSYLSIPRQEAARAALLRQVDPDLLVVFPETAGLVPAGAPVRVVAVGDGGAAASTRLDTLAAGQSDKPVACAALPGDQGVIVSSGGSTGVPKGSWRTFAAYTTVVDVPSPADRRQLINGPLAYLSQVLVDVTLLGGGLVVLQDTFDAADTLATIERERITDLFLVEPQLFELMDHPDVTARDLSSLRAVTHIGASAPPTLRRRARARLGPVIAHSYGASEMGLVSLLSPAENTVSDPEAATSAGRTCPGIEVRFRGADGGLADAGRGGIIEVRSPALASGYLNRPDLERTAFRDGWYRSGDLGRIDAAGCLHVLGRAADAFPAGERPLTPTMIEDVLCGMSAVRYAVVVPDPVAGTWIAAVEAWVGTAVDAGTCVHAVADAYGPDIARRLRMCFVSQVPRSAQGKPDRDAILELGHAFCPET